MLKWVGMPVMWRNRGPEVDLGLSILMPGMQALNMLWSQCLAEWCILQAWKESFITLLLKDVAEWQVIQLKQGQLPWPQCCTRG